MEKSGAITNLTFQERYGIVIRGKKVCTYVADLVYLDPARGIVIEDVKGGPRTAVYKLKKALMFAVLGLTVTEVEA